MLKVSNDNAGNYDTGFTTPSFSLKKPVKLQMVLSGNS